MTTKYCVECQKRPATMQRTHNSALVANLTVSHVEDGDADMKGSYN